MIDWTKTMKQTFEFYEVDPFSWGLKKKLENVESASIKYDAESDGLCSATIDLLDYIGEAYIRIFLVATQGKVTERFSLGTFIVQTPTINYDSKNGKVSVDAYSPLLELKEKYIPNGYTILANKNAMEYAYNLTKDNMRGPVVSPEIVDGEYPLVSNFIANNDDTYLIFVKDLLETINYKYDLDDTNRVLFAPDMDDETKRPVWTYTDDNSSILYPELTFERDIYGIPNVVEVLYSTEKGYRFARSENTDTSNPLSIPSRGNREIVYRDSNPPFAGLKDGEEGNAAIQKYADQLLRNMSTVECTVTYRHGYCPVRVGDCVRLFYKKAGLDGVLAIVQSQQITCEPGCPVEETATFTSPLYQ